MLADRFQLAVHFENREQPVYDLVLARSDGQLGPSIKPSEVDCIARDAAERAAREAASAAGKVLPPPVPPPFDLNAPAPPCTRRRGSGWEGDFTMAMLAQLLRLDAGRVVVDKTGLTGSYRLSLTFDRAAGRGPDVAPSANALPSVFTAIQEQLGLKLESSKALRETLIIDRLERPTEN